MSEHSKQRLLEGYKRIEAACAALIELGWSQDDIPVEVLRASAEGKDIAEHLEATVVREQSKL